MFPMIDGLNRRLGASAPAWFAFVGSLLLSWLAVGGSSVLNRDGMLYVDAALRFRAEGFAELIGTFDWPLLSMLIAGLGGVIGMGFENAGHIIDASLLAGTCALMVDLVRRHQPDDAAMAWATCVAVLAMPGYNGYRDQILREYGYWFFSMLAFWLALQWERRGCRWRDALPCQLAVVGAMLFRLEAAVFLAALIAWQVVSASAEGRIRRVFMLAALPLLAMVSLAALVGAGLIDWPERVLRYLGAANPLGVHKWSEHAAHLLESGVLPEYSRDEAVFILFFGMLSLIPIKFVKMLGLFVVPFAYSAFAGDRRPLVGRWALFGWAFLAHVVALMLFASDLLFLSGRHVSMLTLLAVPAVAAGLVFLWRRLPRWRPAVVVAAVATMIANVVSLGPSREYLSAAGAWLAASEPDPVTVYVDDPRVAYYAGWGFASRKEQVVDRGQLEHLVAVGRFSTLVLSDSRRVQWVDAWLAGRGLQAARRFQNGSGEAVTIIRLPSVPAIQAPDLESLSWSRAE